MVSRPLSLSDRLGLTLASGLLLLGLLVGTAAYRGAAEMLHQAAEKRALSLARQLATFSIDAVLIYDYATLERYIAQLGDDPLISYIEVRRNDGELLARAGERPAADTHRYLLLKEAMRLGDTPIGEVEISYDLQPLRTTLWRTSALGFSALALLIIAAFWFQRRVLERGVIAPVQRLAQGASPLRAKQCPDPSGLPDELRRLAETFRDLCREVQTHLDERERAEQLARGATERLCREQRLASVGQMAAGLAHALNTPLGNIRGYAQLASERSQEEDTRQALQVLQEQAEVCAQVVANLLTAVRPPETRRQHFDLHAQIEAMLRLMRPVLRDKGVAALDLDGRGPLPVDADPAAIEQILFNLLGNAAQAGARTIRVTLSSDGNRARITVADDGPGLPDSVKSQLFSPFNTTKPAGEGTGLGLHLCRSLCEAMGGEITLGDSGPQGTRFDILVDRTAEERA